MKFLIRLVFDRNLDEKYEDYIVWNKRTICFEVVVVFT